MKKVLLLALVTALVTATGCASGLTHGDRTGDDTHAFLLHSAQIIDKIDGDSPPEGEAYLVVKYEVENLTGRQDTRRQWNDQMTLESGEEYFEAVDIRSLEDQLWETSLAGGAAEAGYIAYMVPDEISDFTLILTFPVSGNESVYEFRPVDRRIGVNADFVLSRLEQIERTRRIPLIGGPLASFSSSPIRYLGTVLVPEDEVADLLDGTRDLLDDAKKTAVEDYLVSEGHGRLE